MLYSPPPCWTVCVNHAETVRIEGKSYRAKDQVEI
jgi:hypothetical protein